MIISILHFISGTEKQIILGHELATKSIETFREETVVPSQRRVKIINILKKETLFSNMVKYQTSEIFLQRKNKQINDWILKVVVTELKLYSCQQLVLVLE